MRRHISSVHRGDAIICEFCGDVFKRIDNLIQHKDRKHNIKNEKYMDTSGNFDIRLKENFKLFVSGPSRCVKTVFVAKLIEIFCKTIL